MIKRIYTKTKFINHLLVSGRKRTGEKIIHNSFKNIQKKLKNKSNDIVKLALIQSLPIFKLHRISNKKQKKRNKKIREVPAFLSNINSRISLSIKFVLQNIRKKKSITFYKKLVQELLLDAKKVGYAIKTKNELQKQVTLNKHFFAFYRWK